MPMGPLVSYRAETWLINECQIAFFMSCLMLRNLNPPFWLYFLCHLSYHQLFVWIPVLCSPGSDTSLLSHNCCHISCHRAGLMSCSCSISSQTFIIIICISCSSSFKKGAIRKGLLWWFRWTE